MEDKTVTKPRAKRVPVTATIDAATAERLDAARWALRIDKRPAVIEQAVIEFVERNKTVIDAELAARAKVTASA